MFHDGEIGPTKRHGRASGGRPFDADEIRKPKALVEEGGLTQEEFEHEKRRLLGL